MIFASWASFLFRKSKHPLAWLSLLVMGSGCFRFRQFGIFGWTIVWAILARICVVVINMWIGIPYTMLNFIGVLMNIPSDLYESAELDGAGPFRRFTNITLPYMIFVTAPQRSRPLWATSTTSTSSIC